MSIIFFGTPEFAVPSLRRLYESGEKIALVITQSNKYDRKSRPIPIPVKEFARERSIPVMQPERLRDTEFIEYIRSLNPEFFIVVAYGRILPGEILRIPRYPINLHASLLPMYRGAAPIQWAIINGEKRTGITTILMNEGLDTGDILLMKEVEISPEDNAITLSEKLSEIGAELLIETINGLRESIIKPIPQKGIPSFAPPLKKEDGLIDWNKPAEKIHNMVRGMVPWPCAYTFIRGKKVIILSSRVLEGNGMPGRIETSSKRLIIGTGDGLLEILQLRPEGKNTMDARSFLLGRELKEGEYIGR